MSGVLPKVYLVRHGETAWTMSGQHTGRTDIPLTERGEREAQELRARLRGLTFAKVLTSPLQRARRTGELAGFAECVHADPDLMEWDYGAYEGRRSSEIRAERPGWGLFEDGCPGGETPLGVLTGDSERFGWQGDHRPRHEAETIIYELHVGLKEEKKMGCCSDVMDPIDASSCCTPQDTAAHAARAMRDSGCGCAPVVADTQHRKLVGVVTERDVCCGVAADDRRASEVRVDEIMGPSSACCGADEPVEEARRKLHEHRATSLPVVDGAGACCGTVSAHSLDVHGLA